MRRPLMDPVRESGWLTGAEQVVALNTGMGLKYRGLVRVDVPTLSKDSVIPAAPARA